MEIGDWTATEDLNRIYREIRTLGLESNLAELGAYGFTVIEGALSPELTVRLRGAVVRSWEQRYGRDLDVENETEHHNVEVASYLLFADPAFEEAMLNPRPLALLRYLLGENFALSSITSHVKGPGEAALQLHSDTGNGMPAPFAPYSHVANCNYALTDYTEAGGCLAMVPASHRFFRQPTAWEKPLAGPERNPMAVPLEVPAGSAVVWHGNTWHGSFPRQIPGVRVNLAMFYARQYMDTQERYRWTVSDEFLARHGNDSRVATLLGQHKFFGWAEEGPDMQVRARMRAGLTWQS